MRHTLFLIAATSLLAVAAGCAKNRGCVSGSCAQAPETCQSCPAPVSACRACAGRGCGSCCGQRAMDNVGNFTPGPPTGQITYPYYTTRGPRDFLTGNPPSIGP